MRCAFSFPASGVAPTPSTRPETVDRTRGGQQKQEKTCRPLVAYSRRPQTTKDKTTLQLTAQLASPSYPLTAHLTPRLLLLLQLLSEFRSSGSSRLHTTIMSAIKHHPIFSLISPAATPPRPAPSDDDAVPLVNVPSSSSTPPEDVHKRVDPSATTPPPQKLSKKTPRRPATWKYISHGIGGAGNFHLRECSPAAFNVFNACADCSLQVTFSRVGRARPQNPPRRQRRRRAASVRAAAASTSKCSWWMAKRARALELA
ncbi:hypothetical protein IWX90DRAFT_303554 [Phyllosticta citrichinensis]|uniref:Uncharacterized protein n=1 Tax=Phyllosticta citrichinensis TaxID=1130410 RepID=A0ABR1XLD8_9PEZI